MMLAVLALQTMLALTPPPRENLLIVAPASCAASLDAFVAFKRTQPNIASCRLLILEDALQATESSADAAEKLKRAVYAHWKAGSCDALLLVGDCTLMPFRYMMLDRRDSNAFNTAFYPSDLYYADLARADGTFDDWNSARDGTQAGYFGEVHGETDKKSPINFDAISYLPEIAVGRWPARDAKEVSTIAAKSMETEIAWKQARAKPELLVVAVGGWIDNQAAIKKLARVATPTDPAPWSVRCLSFFDAQTPATEPNLRAALATSPRIVCHTGHGSPHGWEQCLNIETLTPTKDTQAIPVLFSIGCSTAEVAPQPPYAAYLDAFGVAHKGTNAGEIFTAPPPPPHVLQPSEFDANSLSEDAIRMRRGGAACVIGCVTGAQPCAQTLLNGFVEAARTRSEDSVGVWWKAAITHYHNAEHLSTLKSDSGWYPPSIFFQAMKFILLGDPTLHPL